MCVPFVTQREHTDTVYTTGKTQRKHLLVVPPALGLTWAPEELGCVRFLDISITIVGVRFPSARAG